MATINEKTTALVNFRITEEEKSARLYKAIAIALDFNGFAGAAKLFNKYSQEEYTHAGWSYQYLLDLDIQPVVPALPAPVYQFKGLPDALKLAFNHETLITKQCNDFAKAALQEGDFTTLEFAQKFLKEQVDEIAKTTYWLDRLEAFGDSKESLRLLDNEMGCQ